MKVFLRILRTILGLAILAGFAFLFIKAYEVAPKSSDFGKTAVVAETPAPTPEPTPEPEVTPEPTAEPEPEVTPEPVVEENPLPAVDLESWEMVLVNGENSIGEYEPELATYRQQKFDPRIIESLTAFVEAAEKEGLSVYLSSAYRSYSEQAANFRRICANNGVSDGKDKDGHYITMPAGCSEHQTGLCCDITDRYYETKNRQTCENTALYIWMSEHCQEYGFIVRFPDGKEDITGVMFEPWHFRYVGVEAATYIMENGLCFEEFVALYSSEDVPAAETTVEA